MTNIYITSFFKSASVPKGVEKYSAAVYPPGGYEWMPKAQWTDIRDDQGNWTRPRNFESHAHPLLSYRNALMALYGPRQVEAQKWIAALDGDAALCCWCPSDKAAQRQLRDYGSFVCHTAVLGEFISTTFNIPVWYDADRLRMTVLTQHHVSMDK